jgi:hypothetical protein
MVEPNILDEDNFAHSEESKMVGSEEDSSVNEKENKGYPSTISCVSTFSHVLQFCHLCFLKKVPPILYSVASTPEINQWFESVFILALRPHHSRTKHQSVEASLDLDSDGSISSPEQKISRKVQVFINAMLKLHDLMNKSSHEKSDKEPGFSWLEEHRKNLILNASASPPFTVAASSPSEFYTPFLAKKSQFKAKSMILHKLQSKKVAFNPRSSFINSLWNWDFFWLLPDTPSGISIFFCPETKSSNANDIEKEHLLALADKVNISEKNYRNKNCIFLAHSWILSG